MGRNNIKIQIHKFLAFGKNLTIILEKLKNIYLYYYRKMYMPHLNLKKSSFSLV